VPGGTTTSPSGLSSSLAILATSLEEATPTEPNSPPVTSVTALFSRTAAAVTPATDTSSSPAGRRSTNASSSESGSTSGDSSRSSVITARLVFR